MADKVVQIVTIGGENWGYLAYKAWGDAALFPDLVAANRNIKRFDRFPQGITVNIPVKDIKPDINEDLPPWKRS
jgi:hypothetical protein